MLAQFSTLAIIICTSWLRISPAFSQGFGFPVGSDPISPSKSTWTSVIDGKTYTGWAVAKNTDFLDPNYSSSSLHPAEDWNGAWGDLDLQQPVYSTLGGKVIFSGDGGCTWGNIVLIEHSAPPGTVFTLPSGNSVSMVWSQYAHLDTIDAKIIAGTGVVAHQIIGAIGKGYKCIKNKKTGEIIAKLPAYSAHLHFEIKIPSPPDDTDAPNWPLPVNYWPSSQGKDQDWIRLHYVDPTDFINANQSLTPVCAFGASQTTQPHPNGTLVKTADDPTIYLLQDGQRRGITTADVLHHLYNQPNGAFDFSDVITISVAEMNSYGAPGPPIAATLDGNGKSQPAGRLIKARGGTEVSIVTDGGQRRPFSSGDLFLAMGYVFCKVIEVDDYDSYTAGLPIPDRIWPMSGHDPQRTGMSAFLGPKTTPSVVGPAWPFQAESPIIGDIAVSREGNIYFASFNFYALKPDGSAYAAPVAGNQLAGGSSSGYSLMALQPPPFLTGPAIDDKNGFVYIAARNFSTGGFDIYRFNKQLQDQTLVYHGSGDVSQLIVGNNGAVYFSSGQTVNAVGPVSWTSTACPYWPSGAPALGSDGSAYFMCPTPNYSPPGGGVFKVDSQTGAFVKMAPYGGGRSTELMIDNAGIIHAGLIGFDGVMFYGSYDSWDLDLNRGPSRWMDYTTSRATALPDGSTVRWGLAYWDVVVLSFRPATGNDWENWDIELPNHAIERFSSLPSTDAQGNIYVGSNLGLYCLNPLNGNILWRFPTDGAVTTQPAISTGGAIYVGTSSGKVYALSAPSIPVNFSLVVDLFNVDDVERVKLNGQTVGQALYQGSNSVDLTSQLRTGSNTLEIEVENTLLGWAYGYKITADGSIVLENSCGQAGTWGCKGNDSTLGIVLKRTYTVVKQ